VVKFQLRKRSNLFWILSGAQTLPRGEKLVTVQCSPFHNKAARAIRKPSFKDTKRGDVEHCFFVSVYCVEMCRRMFTWIENKLMP
jgi:hypothetical protein